MSQFISSIGLLAGEKNTKQQPDARNDWKNVDWFLHTWGFLPTDFAKIGKLKNRQKDYLICLLLDICWRKCDDKMGEDAIKKVQKYLVDSDPTLGKYFETYVVPPNPVTNRVIISPYSPIN